MNKTLTQKTARIISTLFVPPSFAIVIFTYFAFRFEDTISNRFTLIIVTLFFGFIFHIILFVYLRNKGKLVDLDASVKEERTFPFTIATFFYIIGLIILIINDINIVSIAFWFCYISNTILIIIINRYWKISAHAMGAAGPFAVMLFVNPLLSIIFGIILLLVGWSRIVLKCHNFAQVIAGSVVGFTSTYLQVYLITNYLKDAL